LTATGKIKRRRAFHSHILTSKSAKRKRNLRASAVLDKREYEGIKEELIPITCNG